MIITSPSFQNNGYIPQKFTCEGENISPELRVQNVPENAKSLALIIDDPDAPAGTFTHWTVWNIDPKITAIKENSVPPGLPADLSAEVLTTTEASIKAGAVEGRTDFGKTGYGGPCPPSGKPHRYFFKLYALAAMLNLKAGADKAELEAEIQKHLIAKAELVGLYHR